MIQEFVKAWDANRDKLREYIATHNQEDYDSYEKLLKALLDIVVNPYMVSIDKLEFNTNNIHKIDDGCYQGDVMFFIQCLGSNSPTDYVWVWQWYGSCSGCDTLLGISRYEDGLPNEQQVSKYMTLELHLLQRFRWLIDNKEYMAELRKS